MSHAVLDEILLASTPFKTIIPFMLGELAQEELLKRIVKESPRLKDLPDDLSISKSRVYGFLLNNRQSLVLLDVQKTTDSLLVESSRVILCVEGKLDVPGKKKEVRYGIPCNLASLMWFLMASAQEAHTIFPSWYRDRSEPLLERVKRMREQEPSSASALIQL